MTLVTDALSSDKILTSDNNNLKKSQDEAFGKGFWETTVGFFAQKSDTFFKLQYVGIDWANQFNAIPKEYQPTFSNWRNTAKAVKLSHGLVELPGKIEILCKKIDACSSTSESDKSKDSSFCKAVDVFFATIDCSGPTYDTLELVSTNIVTIPENILKPCEGVNGACLVLVMGKLTVDSIGKIADSGMADATTEKAKDIAQTKITQSLMDMAKSISYIAIGIFVFLSVFFSIFIFSHLTMLILSTSTVFFTTLGFYHKNMYDKFLAAKS